MMRAALCAVLLGGLLTSPQACGSGLEDAAGVLRVALPLYAGAWAWRQDDDEGLRQWAGSTAVTLGTTYALKELIDKERPDGSGDDALPSGHAAAAFSGAAFLQRRYGTRVAWPAWGLASCTAWSRVQTDDHDTVDVAAGAVVAIASAWWLASPRERTVTIHPRFEEDGVGVAFHARFR